MGSAALCMSCAKVFIRWLAAAHASASWYSASSLAWGTLPISNEPTQVLAPGMYWSTSPNQSTSSASQWSLPDTAHPPRYAAGQAWPATDPMSAALSSSVPA